MHSQAATSISENAQQTRTARWHRGWPYMSEKQIQAYLIARDVLRRIQRTSSLVAAPPNSVPDLCEHSPAGHR